MEEKKIIGEAYIKKVNDYEIIFTFSDVQIDVEAHTDRESFYYKSIILYDQLPLVFKQLFENILQVFTTIKQSTNDKISFKDGTFRFVVSIGKKQKQIQLITLKQCEYTLIQLQSHLKNVFDKKQKNLQQILKDIKHFCCYACDQKINIENYKI